MPDKLLAAYTGLSPENGYVSFVNISLAGDRVTFTVRPESEDGTGTVECSVPRAAAAELLEEAFAVLLFDNRVEKPMQPISDEQIKYMVSRFLSWRLPDSFSPDAGISFKPTFNEHTAHPMRYEPTGTNLFNATQADAMVRHMIDDMPGTMNRGGG